MEARRPRETPMTAWLVLMVSVPPHPSSLRVRVWRKLRALGAVALKKSVYILPFNPDNLEHFQWLSQEVQREGGEATLLKVDRLENMTPADVVRRFQEARSQDYRTLAARYRAIAQGLEGKARRPTTARPEEFPGDAIPFDALGAEFGHQGEDCTFETLIKRCGLRDPRLAHLAEIVHEVDLRDQKFHRDEARGVDLVIRGLLAVLKADQDILAHGMTLFDGLYATLGEPR